MVLRWFARVLAVVMFLFWGGFFVEHLWQWFIQPLPQTPPPKVWFGQFLHLLILAGLALGLKWERIGGLLLIGSVVLFSALILQAAPRFVLVTIVPGVLYLYCWYASRTLPKRAHPTNRREN